ncbi:hypothetical protein ABK040_005400 [Willaertia magna]
MSNPLATEKSKKQVSFATDTSYNNKDNNINSGYVPPPPSFESIYPTLNPNVTTTIDNSKTSSNLDYNNFKDVSVSQRREQLHNEFEEQQRSKPFTYLTTEDKTNKTQSTIVPPPPTTTAVTTDNLKNQQENPPTAPPYTPTGGFPSSSSGNNLPPYPTSYNNNYVPSNTILLPQQQPPPYPQQQYSQQPYPYQQYQQQPYPSYSQQQYPYYQQQNQQYQQPRVDQPVLQGASGGTLYSQQTLQQQQQQVQQIPLLERIFQGVTQIAIFKRVNNVVKGTLEFENVYDFQFNNSVTGVAIESSGVYERTYMGNKRPFEMKVYINTTTIPGWVNNNNINTTNPTSNNNLTTTIITTTTTRNVPQSSFLNFQPQPQQPLTSNITGSKLPPQPYQHILTFERPFKILGDKINVWDPTYYFAGKRLVGAIRKKFSLTVYKFKVDDEAGKKLFTAKSSKVDLAPNRKYQLITRDIPPKMIGDIYTGWNKYLLGHVNKEKFVMNFPVNLPSDHKALLLASVILIDYSYYDGYLF